MRKTNVIIDTQKLAQLNWKKGDGLLPAIIQDSHSLRVLMLGYMNQAALDATCTTGLVTFYSRSKARLWQKGEESGNVLHLTAIDIDCDADTLLIQAQPDGPTCHLQRISCFPNAPTHFLERLDTQVKTRIAQRPQGSYVTKLIEQGVQRIAQKVGEEGVETALAAVVEDDTAFVSESADLLFHLLVLLRARGQSLHSVLDVLQSRNHP